MNSFLVWALPQFESSLVQIHEVWKESIMSKIRSNLAVLYARVSSARQFAKDLSVPDQLAQMRHYCRSKGYVIVPDGEYIEDGRTATNDHRPRLREMIQRVTEGDEGIGIVLVHSLSRGFRNVTDLAIYAEELKKVGARFASVTQPVDDGTQTGRIMMFIQALFDENYSAETAKHVKRTLRENARRGFFNGSKPPFGYRSVETKDIGRDGFRRVLALDDSEAAIVREIYDLYEGIGCESPMGMKKIVAHLNEKCLCRGQKWRVQKVQKILSDPVYTGIYEFGGRSALTRRPHDPDSR